MDWEKQVDRRKEVCRDIADLNDIGIREAALREVTLYREVLFRVSTDYRGMEEQQYLKMMEMEADSLKEEDQQ